MGAGSQGKVDALTPVSEVTEMLNRVSWPEPGNAVSPVRSREARVRTMDGAVGAPPVEMLE